MGKIFKNVNQNVVISNKRPKQWKFSQRRDIISISENEERN